MSKPEESVSSIADKVLQLTIERNQTKDRKKASMGSYNEEIKRLEAEIKELIAKTEQEGAEDE